MLADLPAAFRAGCHWTLYARAIAGPNGLPSTDVPKGLPLAQRAEMQKAALSVIELRKVLYPDG